MKKFSVIISKVYKKKFAKICWNFESDLENWKKSIIISSEVEEKFVQILCKIYQDFI